MNRRRFLLSALAAPVAALPERPVIEAPAWVYRHPGLAWRDMPNGEFHLTHVSGARFGDWIAVEPYRFWPNAA